jgi:DNA-binding transcriptional MerR regulator
MNSKILTSGEVMSMLSICENTLLKYEKIGVIEIDFRIGNRKRYYEENIYKSLKRLSKNS